MNQYKSIVKNQLTKSIGLILSVILNPIITIYAADTIWSDDDNPKGRVWLNTVNYEYGPNLHIQNTKPFYFSSNSRGISTLAIENGGILTADGLIITTNNSDTEADALLVIDGGKAYLNDGLTAIIQNPSNGFFSIGTKVVSQTGAELYINGTTEVLAPNFTGRGIFIWQNTIGRFNGLVNVSAGLRGIVNEGTSTYEKPVNISLTSNQDASSAPIAIFAENTTGTFTFNDDVSITMESTSQLYNYGIYLNTTAQNQTIFNGNLSIDLTKVTGPTDGIYTGANNLEINGNLSILNLNKPNKYSIFSGNSSSVNINNSLLDITGRVNRTGFVGDFFI